MKVIFLDIDGVLNSSQSAIFHNQNEKEFDSQFEMLCPIAIALLRHAIEHTQAKIVISSTWRKYQSHEDLSNFFKKHNIEVVGFTKVLDTPRGYEIKEWLSRHPKVKDFIILDDDKDMEDLTNTDHFVHINHHTGLNFFDMQKIINKFNKKSS